MVIVHYADHIFKNRNVMIILKRLNSNYSGENIDILFVQIFRNFDLIERLNYFVIDNANSNDLTIDYIFQILLSYFTSLARSQRRLQYFGYILNFSSGVYLYGKNSKFFEFPYRKMFLRRIYR
jgi:hypothetical protein